MKKTISKPHKSENKKTIVKKRAKKKIIKKEKIPLSALTRFMENPILSPQYQNGWEAWQTFNPGIILLNDRIHFIYRAIGEDGVSRLGYAASDDGFYINERLSHPIYEHQIKEHVFNIFSYFSGGSFGGSEDPRIVQVDGEDVLYMTYTACDGELRVALTSIKVNDFLNKKWLWKSPKLISPCGETHKNWVLFPEKINGKYAVLHSISPEISIAYFDNLEFKEGNCIKSYYNGKVLEKKNCWENYIRGVGAPPIKTEKGWLLFYHAMDNDYSKYKVGAMILDLYDPTKIIYRSKMPILEPEKDYENNGFKAGIVYVSGAAVKNGELLIYYGASDSYVGVASANLEKFLESLTKDVKPEIKLKALKKK